jgi:hypothetical protein
MPGGRNIGVLGLDDSVALALGKHFLARYLNAGPAADRPAKGRRAGEAYYAKDTHVLSVWDGTAWIEGGVGPTGPAGATGPAGHIGIGLDGADGVDGLPVPGPQGTPGATGAAGADSTRMGPPGFDGEAGVDGFPIPGPIGAEGAAGADGADGAGVVGPPGMDGESQADYGLLGIPTAGQTLQPFNYKLPVSAVLMISGGVITVTQSNHFLFAETGTADDLDTINGLVPEQVYILCPYPTKDITVKHLTGNIWCIGNTDYILDDPQDFVLIYSPDGVNAYASFGCGDPAVAIAAHVAAGDPHPLYQLEGTGGTGLLGMPGLDGTDGLDGFPIPGPAGAAGGGGSGIALWDADTDTGIQTEEAADEDKIRFDIAGVEKMVLDSTGLDIGCHAAIGATADPSVGYLLNMGDTFTGAGARYGLYEDIAYTGISNSISLYGVGIYSRYQGSAGSATLLFGLQFNVSYESAQTLGNMVGVMGYLNSTAAGSGTLSAATGFYVSGAYNGSKPATAYGVLVGTGAYPAGVVTAYGVRIEDSAATTSYLLDVGPTTRYFRVIGGAAPGANLTNVYINEGGTLRQVQWKNPDATGHLAAADKVLVLV